MLVEKYLLARGPQRINQPRGPRGGMSVNDHAPAPETCDQGGGLGGLSTPEQHLSR